MSIRTPSNQIHSQLSNAELADFLLGLTEISRPIIAKWFRADAQVETKVDATPVTIADRSVETALRSAIAERFPGDDILGEEHDDQKGDGSTGYKWVIDPIDGTRAFISGKPIFGTLIGLIDGDKPVAGLCDMPMLDEVFIGVGDACHLNENAIRTSVVTDIESARIATTSPDAFSKDGLAAFAKVSKRAAVTNYGGDCHNYALLAAGHIDVVIEDSLAPHDIMGVVGVMQSAGATVTDLAGQPITLSHSNSVLAAATAELHMAVLALINN